MTDKDTILCPVCDVGSLTPARYSDLFSHNGGKILVEDLEKYECSQCDDAPIFTDQVRRNQIKIADAKRRAEGLLTSDQIRKVRDKLGLSQSGAANAFGGGGNAFSKYERGEVLQSFAMDRLLRLAVDLPGAMSLLASYAGETPRESHIISNQAAGDQYAGKTAAALINRQIVPQRRIRAA
jgi:HTH-type transcriptional regulator/antitoxin MqsA